VGVTQSTATSSIERHFPVNELSALVRVERNHDSRPTLYLHKWWARRFGSVFRSIILATFLPPEAAARVAELEREIGERVAELQEIQ